MIPPIWWIPAGKDFLVGWRSPLRWWPTISPSEQRLRRRYNLGTADLAVWATAAQGFYALSEASPQGQSQPTPILPFSNSTSKKTPCPAKIYVILGNPKSIGKNAAIRHGADGHGGVVMRSRVLICWKAERRMSAIRTLLLIGGSTAMLLMLRNYGDAKEER